MSDLKTVEEWATAKAIEHWEVAGLVVHRRWDREPGKLVTEAEFGGALAAFRGISVGGAYVKPAAEKGAADTRDETDEEVG